ncbi:MAG: hypothetical protein HQL05_13705, partial [Nitrospirae bacterium]|nr:hypothetical protein [Nitrospirota bacterium]
DQHVGRHDVGYGLLGRFTYSNTNANSYTHSDPDFHTHGNSYSNCNAHSHGDGNTHTNSYTYCNTYAIGNTNTYSVGNSNSNALTNTNPDNADGHKTGHRRRHRDNINGQPQLER